MNFESVLHLAQKESVEALDIKFIDLFGSLHHITLPASSLSSKLFDGGIGFDGSSVPGYSQGHSSDLILLPDVQTAWIDPFYEAKTLSFLGFICNAGSQEPFASDPRQIAAKAESFFAATGIGDRSLWGPEFEFYIFDSCRFVNRSNRSEYLLQSAESLDTAFATDSGYSFPAPFQGGYHVAPPQDHYHDLRQKMSTLARKAGIDVKYHHHEVGSSGQAEIEIQSGTLRTIGDQAVILKYICRMVARSAGKCVTFMPKPLYDEAGSGMHFHQHLFKGKLPLFYDKEGYAGLSELAHHYIGGLLKHGPALLALTNPSTNSYKRLVPGFEAPVNTIFGLGNRSAAIRIPKYATDPMEKRIEFRPPDATCNIYLAMAAQLMAGIDGIRNKIDPVAAGFGPYDSDVSELPEAERSAIVALPTSLSEALDALESDHTFLLEGGVFSENLLSEWVRSRREQWESLNRRPHPYEMELYFDL